MTQKDNKMLSQMFCENHGIPFDLFAHESLKI